MRKIIILIIVSLFIVVSAFHLVSNKSHVFLVNEIISQLNKQDSIKYKSSLYRIFIFFNSGDCMSCLDVIGKIDDKIIRKNNAFYAIGIMPADDDYSPIKIREDSLISFPIMKYQNINEDDQIFSRTPYIIVLNKSDRILLEKWVDFKNSHRSISDIINEINNLSSSNFTREN